MCVREHLSPTNITIQSIRSSSSSSRTPKSNSNKANGTKRRICMGMVGNKRRPVRRRAWLARHVGVIQSLADHDPDVDGIYRLTQPLPFNFPPATTNDARYGRQLSQLSERLQSKEGVAQPTPSAVDSTARVLRRATWRQPWPAARRKWSDAPTGCQATG